MTEREKIIKEILENRNETSLVSFVSTIKEKNGIELVKLSNLLNIKTDKLNKEGKAILETFEEDKDFPYSDMFSNMKWKILCLLNIQDFLSGIIHNHGDPKILGSRHYFYYESLHLLREYFYCGLNNYLSAADHLLRTFVEFNIKQCYYDFICKKQNSFKPLSKYFNDGISPSVLNMCNAYLPKNSIAKPIKKRIQHLLQTLSEKSSHAYKPIDSIRGNGKLRHEYSIDSLLFWMNLNHAITTVLWSYFLTKPNLFNPKDVTRKFGFNYPMGVFISDFQYYSIVNSISEEDLNTFKSHAKETEEFKEFENHYNSLEDLTDEQIKKTWKKEELKDIQSGYLKSVAEMRAVTEMYASSCTFDAQTDVDESLEPLIRKVADYSWWEKNYKKI
jgi:hypothetical protein